MTQPATTLEDLRALNLLPDTPTAVYLSGSRVQGWGHANSDIDVFVVTAADATPPAPPTGGGLTRVRVGADAGEVTVGTVFHGGERLDVEYWQDGQAERLIRRVEESDVAGGETPRALEPEEADFLFRLSVGVPLAGEEWLGSRQERLARSDFRNLLAARFLDEADELVDDAVGQLRSGDVESALLAARPAFGLAVDALLAVAGELYPSAKWRARKLRRTPLASISWDEYWGLETMADFDPREPHVWVERLVARTQELMMQAELS